MNQPIKSENLRLQIITGVSKIRIHERKNEKKRKIQILEKNEKMKSLQVQVPTMGTGPRNRDTRTEKPGTKIIPKV